MNLHIKTGLGIKNYVWDLNSDVENEIFLTDFSWQIWAKNTKIIFSSESVKTKEHKESNSCEKCYFSISAFYKINFWPILKKLSQKIDFLHFPHFEIFALVGLAPECYIYSQMDYEFSKWTLLMDSFSKGKHTGDCCC